MLSAVQVLLTPFSFFALGVDGEELAGWPPYIIKAETRFQLTMANCVLTFFKSVLFL